MPPPPEPEPLEPISSGELPPMPPPPPPPRPSSMVRSPRKRCRTTSVEYFSAPVLSVHLRVWSAPATYSFEPFFTYFSTTSTKRSLKITTRCHSVRSLRSPVLLSRQLSEVARERFATFVPSCVLRISGSRPRLPTRMTLFTLPAIASPASCHCVRLDHSPDGTIARTSGPESRPVATAAGRNKLLHAVDISRSRF